MVTLNATKSISYGRDSGAKATITLIVEKNLMGEAVGQKAMVIPIAIKKKSLLQKVDDRVAKAMRIALHVVHNICLTDFGNSFSRGGLNILTLRKTKQYLGDMLLSMKQRALLIGKFVWRSK